MKTIVIVYLLLVLKSIFAFAEHALVFVHIGPKIPSYVSECLNQAHLFNPDCSIYFIGNQEPINLFPFPDWVHLIACERLKLSEEHRQFIKVAGRKFSFWHVTKERFLYLNDFIQERKLKNVFHLENDVMLYANLEELLPIFETYYPGMAATFDNEERCIPGFVYIRDGKSMQSLAKLFSACGKSMSDMDVLALFKLSSSLMDLLPVIPLEYALNEPMTSLLRHQTDQPLNFCKHFDAFHSLFDAAAIGQYLGGDHGLFGPGFINESALYNPSLFTYAFLPDEKGRKVPFCTYKGKSYRINTLHIHSKKLFLFCSHF